jgi:8-oxo-dGTP pyrophosphatase MutT (NUDIX family)
VAAIRESFEEAGLLLAVDADGVMVDLHADPELVERFVEHRRAVDAGELGLAELCRLEGLRLAVGSMQYFSRWITPLGAPRRYDTRFLVAHAPEAQTPLHDDREVIASLWIRPEEALARHEAGDFELIFPTVRSLEALQRFDRAEDVVAHAASLIEVGAVLPTVEDGPHGLRIVLPGDGAYDAFTSRRVD